MRRILFWTTAVLLAIAAGAGTAASGGVLYERLGTTGDDLMIGGPPPGGGMAGLEGRDVLDSPGKQKDFLYGGPGNDVLYAHKNAEGFPNTDDLFGGGFCRETGYYGFERTAKEQGWPDPSTLPCNVDGADELYGGEGNDWLWESNSDLTGDGEVDRLAGGPGWDVCVAEEIDHVRGCEDIRIVPTG